MTKPIRKADLNTAKKAKSKTSEKKMGRPTKYTPAVIDILRTEFKRLASVEEACAQAEINPDTFYEWYKKYPKFAFTMDQARNSPILQAKQTVMDKINDIETAKWLLEHRANKEFNKRVETENTVREAPVIIDDIPKNTAKKGE